MKVPVFRHVEREGLGWIETALTTAGIGFEYVDVFLDHVRMPPLSSAKALIFLGGPMSVNDSLPYIRQELKLIEEALRDDIPMLGICLGAQLIAKAAGAAVSANPVKEIGCYPVYWTAEAAADPLFGAFTAPETLFHWHGETFQLPGNAVRLAWSGACAQQAYRLGANTYGLQFHPEVTPAMIRRWLAEDAARGDAREALSPINPEAHAGRMREIAMHVFGRWAERARESAA